MATEVAEQQATFNPNDHLMKLKGKDYLEVKWRLAWFRDKYPHGFIDTEHIEITDNIAIFKARVGYHHFDGTMASATGYGSETPKDFGDFIEKAETKALGRALAALGFGTQFAEDYEMLNPDGTPHVVDAPVESKRSSNGNGTRPVTPAPKPSQASNGSLNCESCGDEIKGRGKYTAEQIAGFIRRSNEGKLICKNCGGG
jgi:hypothetical protein